jgi:hypothetical protein
MTHFSWNKTNNDQRSLGDQRSHELINLTELNKYQQKAIKNNHQYIKLTNIFQYNLIPVIDIENKNIFSIDNQEKIYDLFFKERGAIIIKNVYPKNIMDNFNKWSEDMLKEIKNDKNNVHPKQKNKFLINDLIERMVKTDSDLLIDLIFDDNLNKLMDIILGFGTFGSCTGHWINPKGDRQLSHVDYPIHVGSGKFWNNSLDKLKKITTKHQINNILPYFSIQMLIASDKMDISNGSTEVVPCSHLIEDMDLIIHDKDTYNEFEKYFMNVSLDQGDVLIFNRRLCHRGGKNLSDFRRNSLIIQCVYLWGIGQEIINSNFIISELEKNTKYQNFSEEKKEEIKLRLKKPYPTDVKVNA